MRPDLRTLLAVGAVAIAAASLEAQSVRVTERVITGRNIRTDSLMDRILEGEVTDVKRIVTTWREREAQLVREIRATPETDAASRRRLEEQLALHSRDGFAIMSAIQARCMDERLPRPAGYLGLNLTNTFVMEGNAPKSLGTIVTSVEPASPAERAGFQRNDRILALGGLDARERTPDISAQLVPGRSVAVRLERNGTARDVTVQVAQRPESFGDSCGEFERALVPMVVPGPGRVIVEGNGGRSRAVVVEGGPLAVRRPEVEQEMSLFVFGPGAMTNTARAFFAGAEFRALDADWVEVLGVRQGVIVSAVANGSAAYASGLKGGDVVTAVDRSPVASPELLVQLLGTSDAREATLSVVRAKERKTVTLKWDRR